MCRKLGVCYSITVRQHKGLRSLIEAIPEHAWPPIPYWIDGGADVADAPYLKPRGVRGSRNEPRHVAVTARWLLELRGDDPNAFGTALVAAFDRFVGAGPT